jgi:hypothetical protein
LSAGAHNSQISNASAFERGPHGPDRRALPASPESDWQPRDRDPQNPGEAPSASPVFGGSFETSPQTKRPAFKNCESMAHQRIQLLIDNESIERLCHLEWIGLLKPIRIEKKDRIRFERRTSGRKLGTATI